jgi:TnpA family transposase
MPRRSPNWLTITTATHSLSTGVKGRPLPPMGNVFALVGRGEAAGQVNLRYGNEPGALFYTHISDQYTPFYSKVIAANARDATYVLDGLLYHESDLRIEEHYTDTAGFTDHVFALCHLLGFRFAPRIRDLADKRLYVPDSDREYPALAPLVGGRPHLKLITAQWEEVLRLAASIRHGTVTASLIIRKLVMRLLNNSYSFIPRQGPFSRLVGSWPESPLL